MKKGARSQVYIEEDSTNSISPVEGRSRYKQERLSRSDECTQQDKRFDVIKSFQRSCQPQVLLFREQELATVKEFVLSAISGKSKCRCLIATGMPGAGKTITCTRALSEMKQIRTVVMNAMTSKVLKDLLRKIEAQLYGEQLKTAPNTDSAVRSLLERLKSNPLPRPTVLLIDQFDGLFTKEDESLLSIFELFNHPLSNLTLIGTSNSMEFIEKISCKFQTILPEIKNVVFKPYSSEQFEAILMRRMTDIESSTGIKVSFQDRSLKFISCKMYNAKGGDIRKVLVEVERSVKSVMDRDSQPKKEYIVTFNDVVKVCSELVPTRRNSQLIRAFGLQQQIILVAISQLFKKGDVLSVQLSELTKQIKYVCSCLSLQPPTHDLVKDKLQMIESYGFVAVKQAKSKITISMKLQAADMEQAMQTHPLFGRFFQP